MTETLLTFGIAFLFSFIGTIPPGTLSLTIVQLGLKNKIDVAWRMAAAAAIIEYPYAWIAVEFQALITSSIEWRHGFHIVSGTVMLMLGAVSIWSASRPSKFTAKFEASGFRKGIVLGLLNPLAIPFWMAMTAYLRSYGWIDLSDKVETHAYLLGVSMGTLLLFVTLAYLARIVVSHFNSNAFLQLLPGIVLILLAAYSFYEYIFG